MKVSDKVQQFVDDIMNGAGWATDVYVQNFSLEDFTDRDEYETMILLAQAGCLYSEEALTEEEMESDSEPSENALMTVDDVENLSGWWTDPAGGVHPPQDDDDEFYDPAAMYE